MFSRASALWTTLARSPKIHFNFTIWNLNEKPQEAAKKWKRKKRPLTACTEKRKVLHPHQLLVSARAYTTLVSVVSVCWDYYNWDFVIKGNYYSEVGLLFVNPYISFLCSNAESRTISCGPYCYLSLPRAAILWPIWCISQPIEIINGSCRDSVFQMWTLKL